jgi:tripartite-type tricarboxylate transporter receptor subunit TctC
MQTYRILLALGSAALAGMAPTAFAQEWPTKPITYIVPFTPGGTTDVVGRTISTGLAPILGQPVVIENKPGAAGALGASVVAKAKPDGYTLLGGTISTHAINASLYKDLPYDPIKDFEPVTLVGFIPNALYVHGSLPINSVADLIAYLKKEPNKRTFASSGAGTSTHLAGELFGDLINVKLTHIPYKGTPQAFQDVVAGEVTFMFDQLTAGLPLAKAGKLKLLAVTSPKRSALSPETPTMAEAGVKGLRNGVVAGGLRAEGYAEADRPAAEHGDRQGLEDPRRARPDVGDDGHRGCRVVPEELTALMQKEIPRWADLVKKSGATPN